MNQKKKGSLTSEAYAKLRAEILACRLLPEAKLNISDLCTSMGFSLGAVREALSRLTSEGLVTSEPHKGFRVAPITREELEDITFVRSEIECLCLESAVKNATLTWEAGIVSTLHELSRIPLQDPADPEKINEVWTDAHKRFHEALVATCSSKTLLQIRSSLYSQSERYRQFSVPLDHQERDVHAEHSAISSAVIDRNIKLACELLKAHLKKTMTILINANVTNIH